MAVLGVNSGTISVICPLLSHGFAAILRCRAYRTSFGSSRPWVVSRRKDKDWAYSHKDRVYSRDKAAARSRDHASADNPDRMAAGRSHAS